MKSNFSEQNIVVVLFVMVLITFALAQEDSKKIEKMYSGSGISKVSHQLAQLSKESPTSTPAAD